jgi:hypothetical protein
MEYHASIRNNRKRLDTGHSNAVGQANNGPRGVQLPDSKLQWFLIEPYLPTIFLYGEIRLVTREGVELRLATLSEEVQ